MPPIVVFAGRAEQRDAYHRHLTIAAAAARIDIALHMDPETVNPGTVDYLVFAANGPVQDFTPYTKLSGVL
ncbi:MAG: glyoxylate/hydroxypyruvate reductase A, partial [Thermohalobaculum sp.]